MQHKLYSVGERSPERLSISRRMEHDILALIFLGGFSAFWMVMLYFVENEARTRNACQQFVHLLQNPLTWLHALAVPGFLLYSILKTVRILITGEQFIFDKTDGQLLRNGVVKLKLDDVSHLRVRRQEDSDSAVDYQLSLVHTGGREMTIDRSSDREGILELADEIASFVNKEIESL